ncbi:MAG: VOC family protein [Saprospiraceae bacterium]|nr:VOC family protein [Saprospiraceae bacterium]MBP7679645.1 VOC family protein [Saprospiraceae bacterium]
MLIAIHPKLPMRDKQITRSFYEGALGFTVSGDYDDYLIVKKNNIELHFFTFATLNPRNNYAQIYIRTDAIEQLYQSYIDAGLAIHLAGNVQAKPWGQREFSLLDPDHNLLTFGQSL